LKKIRFSPNVKAEVRAIDQKTAMRILTGLHRYAESGQGDVRTLEDDTADLLRLRIGDYRILFDETPEAIRVHRVRHRSEAYR
jgi:mRNA interferase RelE/StbE